MQKERLIQSEDGLRTESAKRRQPQEKEVKSMAVREQARERVLQELAAKLCAAIRCMDAASKKIMVPAQTSSMPGERKESSRMPKAGITTPVESSMANSRCMARFVSFCRMLFPLPFFITSRNPVSGSHSPVPCSLIHDP